MAAARNAAEVADALAMTQIGAVPSITAADATSVRPSA